MIIHFIAMHTRSESLVPQSVVRTGALARAGGAAVFASDEFFGARIRNPHTRRAYGRAVSRFLAWVEAAGVELARVTPGMAGRFIDTLSGGPAAKQQALSACRQYCTGLVQRHAMFLNPFASVTGERYQVIEGRTPEITISQARALLASFDTASLVGRRDRALFGTLCYTGARIGAVLALRRGDLADSALRLREKGGKQRIIPVRADLHGWLLAWVEAAGIASADAPLFQGVAGGRGVGTATGRGLSSNAARSQLKRRLRSAGLPGNLRPYSFRVLVVTDLLSEGLTMVTVLQRPNSLQRQGTPQQDRQARRERASDATPVRGDLRQQRVGNRIRRGLGSSPHPWLCAFSATVSSRASYS